MNQLVPSSEDSTHTASVFQNTQHRSMYQNLQVLGKVLIRENRLLIYPNVLHHRILPFRLADATKPGHLKMVQLFLVDPNIRIPSTAIVPPQQQHWWAELIAESGVFKKLLQEVVNQMYGEVDSPLSMEQANQVREGLMEERQAQLAASESKWQHFEP